MDIERVVNITVDIITVAPSPLLTLLSIAAPEWLLESEPAEPDEPDELPSTETILARLRRSF